MKPTLRIGSRPRYIYPEVVAYGAAGSICQMRMQPSNKDSSTNHGKLQLLAGFRMLEWSRLIRWNEHDSQFTSNAEDNFTQWRTTVNRTFLGQNETDRTFGQLLCWIAFSVGAEYFGKGICLVREIDIKKEIPTKMIAAPPTDPQELVTWASKWAGKVPKTNEFNHGTIGSLVYRTNPPFRKLGQHSSIRLPPEEQAILIAGYRFLATAMRNRDAHMYVPNVRESDFPQVKILFVRCLNILIGCLPGGAAALPSMLTDAQKLIVVQ